MLTHEKNQAITKLDSHDLEAIYTLECAAFPESMQASYETLALRFKLGHFMLGAWEQNRLVGLVSWRHAWFDPEDRTIFPETFAKFSNAPNSSPYNAAFVYSLGIHPEKRGAELTRALMMSAIDHIKSSHCKYLVGDGRCPSYNGCSTDDIAPSKIFRKAIDLQIQSGEVPSLAEYTADPYLRFYHRTLNCQFLWAMPDFLPSDDASGGHQVIFYMLLNPS